MYISYLHVYVQDSTPAGIIYAEDIEEVVEDLEEAQKDITKVILLQTVIIDFFSDNTYSCFPKNVYDNN